MKQLLFITAVAAYLCSSVFDSFVLEYAVSVLCFLIVIVVFRSVKRFVQVLGAFFLMAGAALLAAYGASWNSFILGFGNMMNILSLFALIPFIALPIELGQYGLRVQAIIQSRVRHSGPLYVVTSFMSYVLSSFMNLATLPMIYHTIRPSLDFYPIAHRERFISRAITHGYSMPIVWTPVAPIVGIVVETTGVRWSAIMPVLVPFSLLGLALDWVMGMWIANRRLKRIQRSVLDEASAAREIAVETVRKERTSGSRVWAGHPIQILLAILCFNGLIYLLERVMHTGFLQLVTFTVIPFAFLWSLLIGKGKSFLARSRTMLPEHLLKMKEQFFVFLSAGFMISAVRGTEAGHAVNDWILAVKNGVGSDVFLLMLPLIPLGLAFIGLHPAVGLALAAQSLNPAVLGISAELTAIAMLTGAATAFLMGPYNATAGLMSNLAGESSYRVSNWNAPFTSVYLLMAMLLLFILKIGG